MMNYEEYCKYCASKGIIPLPNTVAWLADYNYLQTTNTIEASRIVASQPKVPMTWEQYRELALKTESIPALEYQSITNRYGKPGFGGWRNETTRATRLMHAAAGLVTETDELIISTDGTNWIEEIGDCFWYLPIIEQCLDSTFRPQWEVYRLNVSSRQLLEDMASNAASLIDQCLKRHIIYGKELDLAVVAKHTQNYVTAIYKLLDLRSIEPSDVWEANIEKLRKRYPDGRFDVVATSNRDVENELSHIAAERIMTLDPAALISLEEMTARVNDMSEEDGIGKMTNDRLAADGVLGTKPTAETIWFGSGVDYEVDSPITPLMLEHAICHSHDPLATLNLFSDWALRIANGYRAAGADCMAEGFKEVYIKIQAVKGDTARAKAIAVMKDGWMLFQTLPDHPTTAKELQAWLTKSS